MKRVDGKKKTSGGPTYDLLPREEEGNFHYGEEEKRKQQQVLVKGEILKDSAGGNEKEGKR